MSQPAGRKYSLEVELTKESFFCGQLFKFQVLLAPLTQRDELALPAILQRAPNRVSEVHTQVQGGVHSLREVEVRSVVRAAQERFLKVERGRRRDSCSLLELVLQSAEDR